MNNFLLYLASVLIWGSTWLAINFQLGVVAAEVSVVYRHVLASALLFAWALLRRLPLRFGAAAHARFMLLGLFLFGLNYVVAYRAQLYIPSALNAVLFSAMMWINVLNMRLFFGTHIEARVWLGALLGSGGVLSLFAPSLAGLEAGDLTLVGAAFSLSGALLASLGNMVSHGAQRGSLPIIQSNAWGMLYGALFSGLLALWLGLPFNFDARGSYLAALLYLAVFGSVIAFGCYLKLLGRIGPHRAGYASVMIPVVAVVLSLAFEGLRPAPHVLAGIALVLLGNLVIVARPGSLRTLRAALRR